MDCRFVMDAKMFSNVIKGISTMAEEIPIRITQDSIKIETLDVSHVACIFLEIPKEETMEWAVDCKEYHEIWADIRDIASFIKGKEKGMAIISITGEDLEDVWKKRYITCIKCFESKTFSEVMEEGIKYTVCEKCHNKSKMDRFKEYNNIKITIRILSPEGSSSIITLEGGNYTNLPIKDPNISFTAKVVISKKEVLDLIKNLKKVGDEVRITIKDGIATFKGHEKFEAMYSRSDPLVKEIDGEATSEYNLSYLGDIIKGMSSKEVSLSLKDDNPIGIKDTDLNLKYFLAPRVER